MSIREFHPNRFVAPPDIVRNIQGRYASYFPPGGTVADVGCGEGIFLDILRESGRAGIGVDRTADFVKRIRRRGLKAVKSDIHQFLRKSEETFDGVFASHIVEHYPAAESLDLMELMARSLRPGGVIALITPAYEDILVNGERFWLDITHVRPYPLMLLHEVFVHLGMEIVDEGHDPNTRIPMTLRHPRSLLYHFIAKLRFGSRYNLGDAFIVARKPSARL